MQRHSRNATETGSSICSTNGVASNISCVQTGRNLFHARCRLPVLEKLVCKSLQVLKVCRGVNPGLQVQRARFSALVAGDAPALSALLPYRMCCHLQADCANCTQAGTLLCCPCVERGHSHPLGCHFRLIMFSEHASAWPKFPHLQLQ